MTENTKVIVSGELAVHNIFREVVQAIWNEHGICVRSAHFSWVDVSSAGVSKLLIAEVEVVTKTLL